jgi:hypothetical protein
MIDHAAGFCGQKHAVFLIADAQAIQSALLGRAACR